MCLVDGVAWEATRLLLLLLLLRALKPASCYTLHISA